MADFRIAYGITMGNEGGWANNPNDRGGETYKGIARKMHPEWSGWKTIDAIKIKLHGSLNFNDAGAINREAAKDAVLQSSVLAFYKEQFWNRLSLDSVNNQKIANELFDTGVNCAPGVAANFLQRSLNVCNRNGSDYPDLIVDGNIGPKTIAALNNHRRPNEVLKVLNVLQGEKYISICEANHTQEIFMTSWMSRVFENN